MADLKIKVAAIIVAAGGSERMEGIDKVMASLGGRPVLARVLDTFQNCDKVDQIIVVMNSKNLEAGKKLVAQEKWSKVSDVVVGGKRRQDSVIEGLKKLKQCEWIVIHDGARPLMRADLIEKGLDAAKETGAAAPALPVTDTIKFVKGSDIVLQTLPRQNLRAVQTPQVFRFDVVQNTYKFTAGEYTDDASLVEKAGFKVKLFHGAHDNIKITTPDDLAVAEVLLK
jgi:2-C-methyl-D-erythritol 4-phosphate cytidylyltransferase